MSDNEEEFNEDCPESTSTVQLDDIDSWDWRGPCIDFEEHIWEARQNLMEIDARANKLEVSLLLLSTEMKVIQSQLNEIGDCTQYTCSTN